MSRFYSRDGEVLSIGLKEARKIGALPSVTTIIKEVWPNIGLSSWKDSNLILCAELNPRNPGELDRPWIDRVKAASFEKRDTAADFGSNLHDAVQNVLDRHRHSSCGTGSFLATRWVSDEYHDWTDPFLQWVDENVEEVIWTEKVLSSPLGFAGRADARFKMKDGRVGIPDFKTQDLREGTKRPNWYESWPMQLAAYSHCTDFLQCEAKDIVCHSIVFDSSKAGMPVVREWTQDEIFDGWLDFYHALNFWKRVHNYYPEIVDKDSQTQVSLFTP